MLWILLTLIAAFLWSLVAIIDKHAITDELKDPAFAVTLSGIVQFVILAVFSLFSEITWIFGVIVVSILAGVFYNSAAFFYYKSLQHEEASGVVPLLMTGPIFVLILATIFFAEVFSLLNYLGILFLVAGAILISLKKKKKVFSIFSIKTKQNFSLLQ